jgi:hypothetical protein
LIAIDYALDSSYRAVKQSLDDLRLNGGTYELAVLKKLEDGIADAADTKDRVQHMSCTTAEAKILQEAILDRCAAISKEMRQAETTLRARGPSTASTNNFNNGLLLQEPVRAKC